MTDLNPNLPPLPAQMRHLPLNYQGFPVPWFVAWFKDGKPCWPGAGEPDFRVVDTPKVAFAVRGRRCWVCGGHLGRHLAFTIGPMCTINRVSAEPPSHRDCAVFSATACPFLTKPRMRRNDNELPVHMAPPGIMLERNPGAVAVWITKSYRPFRTQVGPGRDYLFEIGDPEEVLWFANGRTATRAEVEASIESGLPLLMGPAQEEGAEAMRELAKLHTAALQWLPPEIVVETQHDR